MSFSPLQGNCPICQGLRKDCRRSNITNLIFCRDSSASPAGYIFRGIDSHGFGYWQSLQDAEEFKSQSKDELQRWQRENLAAKQRRQEEFKKLLPTSERNKHYRRVINNLELSSNHINALKQERGLSPQEIDFAYQLGWLRSFKPGIEVDASGKIAGVHPTSHRLLGVNGIAIAATDGNQDITGFQIGSDDREKFGKYIWLSSKKYGGSSPHLPNGELPLFIWKHPQARKINEVWLVEGALKSLITALNLWFKCNRKDVMVIGAAGGNFAGSLSAIKEALQQTSCKDIRLQPDAGAVANAHIIGNYRKILNALSDDGYECSIGYWGQSKKSLNDIDEIPTSQYKDIRYLSISEFKSLCIKWGGYENKPEAEAIPIDYQERVAKEQKKLHSLTYPSDFICDSSQKYLPDLLPIIPKSGIVGIKAPKGSGKSYQIKEIKKYCCGYWEEKKVYPDLEPEQLPLINSSDKKSNLPEPTIERIRHKGLGMNFITINARIALGRGQAVQWDFTWIEDADTEGKDNFETKLSTLSVIENIDEIGCCWDSLGKFFGRDWSKTLVVIDEIELGLNHVSTSNTCKERRSFILKTLEVKLKECLDNGGLLIAADADLSDIPYEYLEKITGVTPYVVEHDFKGEPWNIEFYTGKRDVILSQIEDWVSNPDCGPIAVALDNQQECEALANHLIKKYPYLKNHKNGLIRIDSKITQTDFGKDFVKFTNKKIGELKPKILLYTPSLGVGCSLDTKYFTHVFGLFFGNLEPSQARQALARERQPVPRTVWCKAKANSSQDTPTSYLPGEIKKRLFSNQQATTEVIQLALELAKAKKRSEQNDGGDYEDKEILPLLIEQLQLMMGDGGWDNAHLDLYCQQVARRNYALNQYAVQLRQELIDEGHKLIDIGAEEKTNAGDSVRHEKDEIKHQKANATANATDIDTDEAIRIKNQPSRTEEQNHQAAKALLKKELPGVELTPEFLYKAIYKDDRRWLNQVKLFWFALNPDIAKELDSKEWRHRLKQFSDGVFYLPDIKSYSHKIEVIHRCGVLNFLEHPEKEYSEDSPEIQQFIKDCKSVRKKLKSSFGIKITKDTQPIKLLNRLLGKINQRMKSTGNKGKDGERKRYYKLDSELLNDAHKMAVIGALDRKFKNHTPKIAVLPQPEAIESVHEVDNFLYKNEVAVRDNKPMESSNTNCSTNADFPSPTEEMHSQKSNSNDTDDSTQWHKPENITEVAQMLEMCESPEALELLRQCDIPAEIFKIAARKLPNDKRIQIREWVLESA